MIGKVSALSRLVVVEGAHGTGKTTLAKSLVKKLRGFGTDAIYTKEPYFKPLLDPIAQLSLETFRIPLALAYLIGADRYFHVEQIAKWSRAGSIVVGDRYVPSSLVYQRIDGLSVHLVNEINKFAPKPKVQIFLVAPFETRIKRIAKKVSKRPGNYFMSKTALKKEQLLYDRLIEHERKLTNCLVLNGSDDLEQLVDVAFGFIRSKL